MPQAGPKGTAEGGHVTQGPRLGRLPLPPQSRLGPRVTRDKLGPESASWCSFVASWPTDTLESTHGGKRGKNLLVSVHPGSAERGAFFFGGGLSWLQQSTLIQR